MKSICITRDKDQNMLDLGPLHHRVHKYIQKIIDNSDIHIGASSSHLTASLDGDEWQNSNVMSKVLEIAQKLPYNCLALRICLWVFSLVQQIFGSDSHLN